ncbi:TonB-linked outer membrane protein, SusC/RagA family [Salegentibacter agarivorans]|uniref:TonB-linked outer membrane protein, SusC/RagA family n=1 Tax=Salegentibacter agarivorans TaxID=345907 RepID=A0A1I2MF27_9FLAO|nr:TonB-dependent receptor [Salegentibacter agarivorans]SFF89588.1 TonB-linked outer membrane protein, SusC/RagA family [Salegentibacter agarivorans]
MKLKEKLKCYFLGIAICLAIPLQAQEVITIRGNITSIDDNMPLPGVNVFVKGSTNGTVTDFDGDFSLQASTDATLVVSFLGFKTLEIPVEGRTDIDITLSPDDEQLSEVVVVGYGSQQRRDLTGSVATVQSEEIKDIPVASVDQKLAGQIPGVQVSTVTGTPGGAARIKIRGSGSIGANSDPLVVIDGFPISNSFNQTSNPLNLLNPDDIASISVLKDASSTAIYGSRGANGVIIIETKQGRSGKLQIDFNTYTGFQQVPDKGRPDLLNGRQFAQFQKEIREDAAIAAGGQASDANIPEEYQNPEMYGEGTDWYETILQTAPQHNVYFNVRGGSDNLRGALSLGYFNQEGVIKYTGFERYTIRTSLEANLTDRLKVGIDLAPTFSIQDTNNTESDFVDVVGSTQWLNPTVPVTDENGNRTPFVGGSGLYENPNPLNSLEFAGTEIENFRGLGTVFAELEVFEGFKAKYSYTADYSNGQSSQFIPSFIGATNLPPPIVPSANLNRSNRLNQSSQVLLNYNRYINDNHSLDLTAGFETQKERSENIILNATDFPDDEVQTIGAAGRINGWNEIIQEWALLSYFARVNYNFKSKYLLTATIRSDGSSRFGDEERYGTFPSLGAAWQISEESFMENSFFENLKLRASYGLSGNFNIGNYTHLATIGSSNYVSGNSIAYGRALNSLGNPNLTWEESNQLDVGVEGDILNNRLSFIFDYYRRTTNNMLIDTEIPSTSGFQFATINGGEILNEGLEIGLNSQNIKGEFTWNTNFNIAFNRNEVLSLEGDNNFILAGRSGEGNPTHITQVGKPIGQFYGYVLEGVYTDQEDLDNSPQYPSAVPGSIKYKDINNDGLIEAVNDFAIIGDPTPDFTFGVTNSFNYKNFDLTAAIDGQYGGDILVGANQFLKNIDGIFNVTTDVLDRWRSPEEPGDGVTPTTNGGRVPYRDVNSSWVEDASFLRMRNLTLGYSFESFFQENGFIKQARIYSSVNNAFIITDYSRGNPQVANSANRGGGSLTLAPGVDFTSYPLARTFILGLNFSF